MNRKDYSLANQAAWNEVAPRHRRASWQDLVERVKLADFCALDDVEKPRLLQLGIPGKAIAHLCCNSGIELLSLARLGAKECTGFDISDQFIEQARELAQIGGVDCEFVCTDVYEIPESYRQRYDLIYLSAGTLGWMPDLPRFISVARSLLKESGQLFIYETHPILDMLGTNEESGLRFIYSYFRTEPIAESEGLDYLGNTKYEAKPTYWFHHKLGDIFSCILNQGFQIRSFEEFDKDISTTFPHLTQQEIKPPMSYILRAAL